MWITVLDYDLDLLLYCTVVMIATFVVHRLLRRADVAQGIGRRAWIVMLALLTTGSLLAYQAGESERKQLRQTLEGFAPTYAIELARNGHANVHLDTKSDDPNYLALIESEKRWLAANPAVNDIYTFRKTPEGKFVFIVDSETDYDRNGVYDGEREQRTAIGEEYTDVPQSFREAADGRAGFDDHPYVDRWGVWVTATCPIVAPDGKVDGGVGVDFDAHHWISAILLRRAGVLGFFSVAVTILIWSGGIISLARRELDRRRAAELAARQAESRMQTILDNAPEGVLVCDRNGVIAQINPSGLGLLDLNALPVGGEQAGRQSLANYVEDNERTGTAGWIAAAADGKSARRSLRLLTARGTEKWVEAHAVTLRHEGETENAVLVLARDVTAARAAEQERERLQRQLVDASRAAGMADIATGVLHNVGNVLNTVNVSAHVLTDKLRQSRVPNVGKAAKLLVEQKGKEAEFLTADARGKQFPDYLDKLATALQGEHEEMLGTLRGLSEGLDHIKAIVASQQSVAKRVRAEEPLRPAALFEEAVHLNVASCDRHHVGLVREFEDVGSVVTDKHKVLQILVNLINNAKDATKNAANGERRIALRIVRGDVNGRPSVRFEVQDNGMGIAPENLTKIFRMGFTTRKEGHGFGLHSSANMATELGGTLTVHSDGPGKGARFTLEIPMARTEVAA